MFCQKCGHKMEPGERFCTNCGAKQPEQPQQTAPSAPKPEQMRAQPFQTGNENPHPSGGKKTSPAIIALACVLGVAVIGGAGFAVYHVTHSADTAAADETVNVENYLGYWMIDRYSDEDSTFAGFQLGGTPESLTFTANQQWNHGEHTVSVGQTSLVLSDNKATGSYTDSAGVTGAVTVEFSGEDVYLTMTGSGTWSISADRYHCTRDPFGADRDYTGKTTTQQANTASQPSSSASSTYSLYVNGSTASQGMNDLSGASLGSSHLWPTDTLYITDSDLGRLTRMEVAAIRNEIYARHGYSFNSAEWKNYFSTATWYSAGGYSNNSLNSTEKKNVEIITGYEKAKGWSQSQASGNTSSSAQPVSSPYKFYINGSTSSQGMGSLSGMSIGSSYLWPTDTLTITDSDLNRLTRTEVAAVRNEIYARHGYSFSSSEWKNYFNTASWYYAGGFSEGSLNSTEKKNVDVIANYEKARGWNQ